MKFFSTVEQESVRDFVRCRFSVRKDVTRAKHRIVKMLDRKGRIEGPVARNSGRYNGWTSLPKTEVTG